MNEKLQAHIADLLNALHELPSHGQAVREQRKGIQLSGLFQGLERWATEYRAVVEGVMGDVYRRIALHADAALQLADDERARAILGKLSHLATAEIRQIRENAEHLESVSDSKSFSGWVLRSLPSGVAATLRRMRIVVATTELERYFDAGV
jgi:hypothetical protein